MRIIAPDGSYYNIDEDGLNAAGPIQIQIQIGIPGTNQFSQPFLATFDPGASGCPSLVLPLALLKKLKMDQKLPALDVSEATMADGSTETSPETLISLRLVTIPLGQSVVFDGVRCAVSPGADINGALIGLSVLRFFDIVLQNSKLRLLTLSKVLPSPGHD